MLDIQYMIDFKKKVVWHSAESMFSNLTLEYLRENEIICKTVLEC